jgi:hypothetical protein
LFALKDGKVYFDKDGRRVNVLPEVVAQTAEAAPIPTQGVNPQSN